MAEAERARVGDLAQVAMEYRDRDQLRSGSVVVVLPDWMWARYGDDRIHETMRRMFGERAQALRLVEYLEDGNS